MSKYRIMQTDDGKYVAQIRTCFFWWDDIFYAGVLGLIRHSWYISHYGERHNNRYSDTIKECEDIIEAHKRRAYEVAGKNLIKRVK